MPHFLSLREHFGKCKLTVLTPTGMSLIWEVGGALMRMRISLQHLATNEYLETVVSGILSIDSTTAILRDRDSVARIQTHLWFWIHALHDENP
ncbi:hypothetical protein ABKN59_003725 [Abortiporus biennis]